MKSAQELAELFLLLRLLFMYRNVDLFSTNDDNAKAKVRHDNITNDGRNSGWKDSTWHWNCETLVWNLEFRLLLSPATIKSVGTLLTLTDVYWVLFRYSLFKNCYVCFKMCVNRGNLELNDILKPKSCIRWQVWLGRDSGYWIFWDAYHRNSISHTIASCTLSLDCSTQQTPELILYLVHMWKCAISWIRCISYIHWCYILHTFQAQGDKSWE